MTTSIITGAGSGIGLAIATRLAKRGDEVVVFDHNPKAGTQTVAQISQDGGKARFVECDVSDTDSVSAAFAQIERVDVLVNNAGIAHVGNVQQTTPKELDRLYSVNIKGVYHCLHFSISKMLAHGGGTILNLASIASKIGIQDRFAYSMTKGAVFTMTLSVARDYVDKNIRCNCICPARVHTPFVDGYLEDKYPPEQRQSVFETLSRFQPIGRMGRPEEVAALADFLTSNEAAFITGSAYDIDGGATLLR